MFVSGIGAKGTSYVTLSDGASIGPDEAGRLAGLLRRSPLPLLTSLDLRHAAVSVSLIYDLVVLF